MTTQQDPTTVATDPAVDGAHPSAPAATPGEVFQELAVRIYASDDPDSVRQSIVDACVELIDGCDHASLMFADRSKGFRTGAATSAVARAVDQLEIEVGEGPCVDAIVDEAYQRDSDMKVATQWPRLAKRVLGETPVRGAIGYRLLAEGRKVGALNVFSDTPDALTEQSADTGAVLAAFASVALATLTARHEAESLRAGLESNREIGKAVGLLMAAHRTTADEAFGMLRKTSQDLNMKLVNVAAQVVEGQERQFGAGR